MKCINKKVQDKQKEVRRKKLKKSFWLIGIFILLLAVGLGSLVFFSRRQSLDEPFPYDRSTRAFGTVIQEEAMTAHGIAKNLCVGESDQQMEGINSRDGELTGLFAIADKEIPFAKGIYERISPGKITQLMTALLAYENLNLEDSITISSEDLVYSGVSCGLGAENVISARQLLNAVLVYSAEDACQSLARAVSQGREAFVEKMNTKAQELGMTNTHFTNVTGATDEDQYTTVYDVYLLLNEVLKHQDMTNAMGLPNYVMNYKKSNGEIKQQWLDSNNPYVTGRITIPKGVTVLGGTTAASSSGNYAAMLVQNNYGDAYAVIVLKTEAESTLHERIGQMLEKITA